MSWGYIGAAAVSVVGGAVLSKKSKDSSESATNLDYLFKMKMLERQVPLSIMNMSPDELSKMNLADYGFGEGKTPYSIVSPTSITKPTLKKAIPYEPITDVSGNIAEVQKNIETRMRGGIPQSQKDLILKQAQIIAEKGATTASKAIAQYTGEKPSGISKRAEARLTAETAQGLQQSAFDLEMESLAEKRLAEKELIELGKYSEARKLSIEQENIRRDAINNAIEEYYVNFDKAVIDEFNTLVMQQQSLYAGQGVQLAATHSEFQSRLADISTNYYNGLAELASTLTQGVISSYMQSQTMKKSDERWNEYMKYLNKNKGLTTNKYEAPYGSDEWAETTDFRYQ